MQYQSQWNKSNYSKAATNIMGVAGYTTFMIMLIIFIFSICVSSLIIHINKAF